MWAIVYVVIILIKGFLGVCDNILRQQNNNLKKVGII